MIDTLWRWLIKSLLWLRYRIRLRGLEEVAAKGTGGILFLPNHPGLIDPVIVGASLHKRFRPRFLGDRNQVRQFPVRLLAKRMRVLEIPDLAGAGLAGKQEAAAMIQACVEALRAGDNVVLYPAGRIMRSRLESLGAASGAATILSQLPGVRVVLVRTRGLWGSGFGCADGRYPNLKALLKKAAASLLLSGIFFAPRRRVEIQLAEPPDLPRDADRLTLNRFLEEFYNQDAPPRTFVPYTPWRGAAPRVLPEVEQAQAATDASGVADTVRQAVYAQLRELTGVQEISDSQHLARDLGMDSLVSVELLAWLSKEFGFPPGDVESVRTVADALLAASGQALSTGAKVVKPPPAGWQDSALCGTSRARIPATARTIPEAFLEQAAAAPGRVIIADQNSGGRSYRQIITGILALRPRLERLPGTHLGILLPASVGADVCYLAAAFAGKVPVMVNWTVGMRNLTHCLDLAGVRAVLTTRALIPRLEAQGIDFSGVADRFVYLEDIGRQISLPAKLGAALRARFSWRSLRRAAVAETAVVLFTSGSESLPKAVPLTHANILANLRDATTVIELHGNDCLLGMLPPFHSFGLAVGIVLPLCAGFAVAHHPNPTEGALLGRLIENYGATALAGTPTFVSGIARVSSREQLASLRLVVTGAEKCPERAYDLLAERCPGAVVLEGYGITECSPVVSLNRAEDPRRGTIGRVLPGVEFAIVDPERRGRVGTGSQGLLLVRGPSIFAGYLNFSGASPFVEFEGKSWYSTGDLVSQDADGVLTFAGRLKRFVKIGGEMVSLPAVESALAPHYESEADAGPVLAVESAGDDQNPELVLFCTGELDRETVNRQLRDAGLSPIHNIRRVVRLDAIPLLGTGKTDYRGLRDMLKAGKV